MSKRFLFHNPNHAQHKGWTDDSGKLWDVPDRVEAIVDYLSKQPSEAEWHLLHEANAEQSLLPVLHAVHDPAMIYALREASETATEHTVVKTIYDRDTDTDASAIHPGTYQQALRAAECAMVATGPLLDGTSRLSVALCRPPGHHAGRLFYHGFCYFNNAAVATETLRGASRKRIAILDIDVHHGDGTQDIFYNNPDVLYVSLHADPRIVFPGTGYADERGTERAWGTTLNLPFTVGASVAEYQALLLQALEAIDAFSPSHLVVSAGFDSHKREFTGLPPITMLEDSDYYEIGLAIRGLGLPTCMLLEGGYNLATLPAAFTQFLDGVDVPTHRVIPS